MIRKYNVSLKNYCTFKIGGSAKSVSFPKTEEEFVKEIFFCRKKRKRFLILGNGSNVLFSDDGFDGEIISTRLLNKISCFENDEICCEAGVNLNVLCKYCAQKGLKGIEKLFGIPGSVGGAIIMNAGAFDCEICRFVKKIRVLKGDSVIEREPENFSYRKGPVEKDEILLSASFHFRRCDKQEIDRIHKQVLEKRKMTQPFGYPSAGSVFKRNKNFFPAKLIDEWGLKGLQNGGAMISNKHAGFIVNFNNAKSKDVLNLINFVEEYAKKRGYEFEKEIIVIT